MEVNNDIHPPFSSSCLLANQTRAYTDLHPFPKNTFSSILLTQKSPLQGKTTILVQLLDHLNLRDCLETLILSQ